MNKCPCKDCICIAICRYKNYSNMVETCSSVRVFIYDRTDSDQDRYKQAAIKVEDIINPIEWTCKWGKWGEQHNDKHQVAMH